MSGLDAYGVQLQRSDMGSPANYTAIANVTDLTAPKLSRATYEVTDHDSPDQWEEHIGGFRSGGEVTLEVHYRPTRHDQLIEDLNDPEPRDYRLVWPPSAGSTVWDLSLILTAFEAKAPVKDKLVASVTFKVTGKPTITP